MQRSGRRFSREKGCANENQTSKDGSTKIKEIELDERFTSPENKKIKLTREKNVSYN